MFFETNRSIGKNYIYTQTDDNLDFVSHVHNSFEFITVLEGELECSVYRESFTLVPGKAMLILPNHVHNYRTPSFSRSFLCVFSADYVAEFYEETKNSGYFSAVFDFTDNGEIDLLKTAEVNKYILSSVFYGFCGKALPHLVGQFETAWGGALDLSVKLLYYIQKNYDKSISLKEIAGEMGYNYTYLSNVFNKIFGCGFSRYVNRFRVENAAELLRKTGMSMVQISNSCGFESLRSFNEQFKSEYGVAPTVYRAKSKETKKPLTKI